MVLEISLFIAYLFLGPILWILFAIGAASSRRRMQMLRKRELGIPDPPPLVTILIPAKDEGARIGDCLASALGQDYPNFSVLAIDDRSGDATGRVMDDLAKSNAKLKVLHIDHLPAGWTGKNNALYRGAALATGEWLLFIDSDVILQRDALTRTLAVATGKNYDLLSLILRLETPGIWESILIPLASAAFGAAFMMGMSNSDSNNYFFGNGQFMLMRRTAYDKIGGHEAVKTQFNEDMVLARIMKQSGQRVRIAWGTHLGSVRMYDSLATILRGWSRIFFGSSSGSPWRSVVAMLFILLGCYPAYAAIAWGVYRMLHPVGICTGYPWLGTAGFHIVLMTVQLGIVYRWMGNRAIYALLFPVAAPFILFVLARSVWMCLTGKVHWRGTRYSHEIQPTPTRE